MKNINKKSRHKHEGHGQFRKMKNINKKSRQKHKGHGHYKKKKRNVIANFVNISAHLLHCDTLNIQKRTKKQNNKKRRFQIVDPRLKDSSFLHDNNLCYICETKHDQQSDFKEQIYNPDNIIVNYENMCSKKDGRYDKKKKGCDIQDHHLKALNMDCYRDNNDSQKKKKAVFSEDLIAEHFLHPVACDRLQDNSDFEPVNNNKGIILIPKKKRNKVKEHVCETENHQEFNSEKQVKDVNSKNIIVNADNILCSKKAKKKKHYSADVLDGLYNWEDQPKKKQNNDHERESESENDQVNNTDNLIVNSDNILCSKIAKKKKHNSTDVLDRFHDKKDQLQKLCKTENDQLNNTDNLIVNADNILCSKKTKKNKYSSADVLNGFHDREDDQLKKKQNNDNDILCETENDQVNNTDNLTVNLDNILLSKKAKKKKYNRTDVLDGFHDREEDQPKKKQNNDNIRICENENYQQFDSKEVKNRDSLIVNSDRCSIKVKEKRHNSTDVLSELDDREEDQPKKKRNNDIKGKYETENYQQFGSEEQVNESEDLLSNLDNICSIKATKKRFSKEVDSKEQNFDVQSVKRVTYEDIKKRKRTVDFLEKVVKYDIEQKISSKDILEIVDHLDVLSEGISNNNDILDVFRDRDNINRQEIKLYDRNDVGMEKLTNEERLDISQIYTSDNSNDVGMEKLTNEERLDISQIYTSDNSNDEGMEKLTNEEKLDISQIYISDDSDTDLCDEEKQPVQKEYRKRKKLLVDRNLEIDFEVPPLHDIFPQNTLITPQIKRLIEERAIIMKTGKFSMREDKQIRNNWYNFVEKFKVQDSPMEYFYLNPNVITKHEKKIFLYHLGRGLPDRNLGSVFKRFRLLFSEEKGGKYERFTKEEDKIILGVLEKTEKHGNYIAEIAKKLNRTKTSVERRLARLKKGKTRKIKWIPRNVAPFIKYLMKVTRCDNVMQLKNRHISKEEWAQLSETLDELPLPKLRQAWYLKIHPRLFIKKDYINLRDVRIKLINLLLENNERDWKLVDWNKYASYFDGFTTLKLFHLLHNLIKIRVPKTKRSNLRKSLKILKSCLEDGDLRWDKYLTKIYYKNGKVREMERPDSG